MVAFPWMQKWHEINTMFPESNLELANLNISVLNYIYTGMEMMKRCQLYHEILTRLLMPSQHSCLILGTVRGTWIHTAFGQWAWNNGFHHFSAWSTETPNGNNLQISLRNKKGRTFIYELFQANMPLSPSWPFSIHFLVFWNAEVPLEKQCHLILNYFINLQV